MAEWVDTHCHLQMDTRDPAILLNRAGDVRHVVVPGVDLASSAAARQIALEAPGRAFFAAGMHPHEADRWAAERDGLLPLMEGAVAIGETGLDFYRNLSPAPAQMQSFLDHHRIATRLSKPLIVHCRDAFRQIYEVLEEHGAGPWVVLHCWTGGPRWSKRFLEMGVTFSFAGPVTYKNGDTIRRGAAVIPPERAVVETDSPFLAPEPHRRGPNEPRYVSLTGAALARIWGLDAAEVARLTTERAIGVFGL